MEYTYPGIYVEEKSMSTPAIAGISTSTGAFVGFAQRGEVGKPVFVTSWVDFVNKFALNMPSPFMKNAYLAYQVYGFFNNGGRSAWIVRVTDGTDAKASVSLPNGTAPIVFSAKDAGLWGNAYSVRIEDNDDVTGTYDVVVLKGTEVMETHRQLGLTDSADNHFVGTINQNSAYINVATTATAIEPTSLSVTSPLVGGTDGLGTISPTHLIEGVKKFDAVQQINLLVVAESQAAAVALEADAYARKRKDCIFVADGGMNDTFDTIQTFKSAFNSEFTALYYPWIEVNDPIGVVSKTKYIPTAGHVAGAIARNDATRGVFKAPAGTQLQLNGVLGVKELLGDAHQGILNPKGINVIRSIIGAGIVIWGARTTASTYINVRRELNFIMSSIPASTNWSVFEPNGPDTWRKLRNQVKSLVEGRRLLGAYQGTGEGSSYFVKCDAELNPPSEVDAGRMNLEVGVAINKPGEFVIFRVGQWDGGSTVTQQ